MTVTRSRPDSAVWQRGNHNEEKALLCSRADRAGRCRPGIGPRSEGGFGLTVALEVSLPGMPKDAAQKLVNDAHQVCPYSNATRNNVPVRLVVV